MLCRFVGPTLRLVTPPIPLRSRFYDGDVKEEPGAVVCRVARSFVRFGTFQLPSARGGEQLGLVRRVADHVIRRHYPHLNGDNGEVSAGNGAAGEDGAASPDPKYLRFLKEVAERTAATVVHWHRVGFVHGVLNTDNMSILGVLSGVAEGGVWLWVSGWVRGEDVCR